MRARRGLNPMATPTGIVQSAPSTRARFTRRKVASRPIAKLAEFGAAQTSQYHDNAHQRIANRAESRESHDRQSHKATVFSREDSAANFILTGKVMHHPFAERTKRPLTEERDAPGTLEKIEYP